MVVFQAQAGIAQSVEHFTRNEGVVSSSLISSLPLLNPDTLNRVSGFLCYTADFLYSFRACSAEKLCYHSEIKGYCDYNALTYKSDNFLSISTSGSRFCRVMKDTRRGC